MLVAAGAVLGCGAARPPEGSIAAVLVRDPESGRVVVREVPAGRAAAVAGLAPDDQLKMVDGVHVDDLDAASLVRALRGPVGSAVTLTVVRGPAVREVEVRREPRGRRVEAVPERGRLE
ncbi:MAG: PDZ domain-containing protein [Deltaproteobacteria bacterium]|nr:PDZ domain-containing protein [Deltaproteobacteria bacterium]